MAIYSDSGFITSRDTPLIRPTLDLNFAKDKRLDSRVTFTRASSATYTDEYGVIRTVPNNVPRFDHDPTTGESLGLLIEESRTNIALNSEDFSTRSATNYGTKSSVTTNAIISPDGTQNADLVTTVTTTTQNRLGNLHSVTTGQVYTYSVYVKQGNKSNVIFYLGYAGLINASVSFTFSTEEISGSGGSYIANSAGFEKLNNGWYRIYFSGSAFASGTTYSGFFSDTTPDETFYVWGEQIEAGSFPTSYIPTSGSTVTRAADLASITGTNFSEWYNSAKGSFIVNAVKSNFTSGVQSILGTNQKYFDFALTTSGVNTRIGIASPDLSVQTTNIALKVGSSYNDTTHSLSVNGSSTIDDTHSSGLPNNTILYIGRGNGNNYEFIYTGTIGRITYYPTRLPNDQLQTLTS